LSLNGAAPAVASGGALLDASNPLRARPIQDARCTFSSKCTDEDDGNGCFGTAATNDEWCDGGGIRMRIHQQQSGGAMSGMGMHRRRCDNWRRDAADAAAANDRRDGDARNTTAAATRHGRHAVSTTTANRNRRQHPRHPCVWKYCWRTNTTPAA
jgi:hypothetical protein